MALDGIGGFGPGIVPVPGDGAQQAERAEEGPQFDLESGKGSAQTPFDTAPDLGSMPSRAPTGADPEAWALLTSEERAFFDEPAPTGPLTYGRKTVDAALAALGARLDVRG